MIPRTLLLCALPLAALTLNAAPGISGTRTTDITPGSFSVVWLSNEAATAGLEVYSDPGGTNPVAGAVITGHPLFNDSGAVKVDAEDRGVMKAMAAGLDPATSYYFRTVTTSKADSSVTTGTLTAVQTANTVKRISPAAFGQANPVIRFDCYESDGVTPAGGSLMLVSISGALTDLATFVGEHSVPAPTVLLDLNNLFSAATGETLILNGGEALTLTHVRGPGEEETYTFYLPDNDGTARTLDPYLVEERKASTVLMPRETGEGIVQYFMEFPVTPGKVYQIQYSNTGLDSPDWQVGEDSGFEVSDDRLFWYDNGEPRTDSPVSSVPRRFYRAVEVVYP